MAQTSCQRWRAPDDGAAWRRYVTGGGMAGDQARVAWGRRRYDSRNVSRSP